MHLENPVRGVTHSDGSFSAHAVLFTWNRQKCLPWVQVVIAGARGNADTEALIQAAHSVFAPDKVLGVTDRNVTVQCLPVHRQRGDVPCPVLGGDMCWRLPTQVIISIDPTQQQEMDYWQQHNPEAYSMVKGAAEKLQDRCAMFPVHAV